MAESTVPSARAGPQKREPTRSDDSYVAPAVDIFEDEQGLVVLADLPGVDPEHLDVRVDRGVLTIQGRAEHVAQGTILQKEYELSGFYRQFQLPDEIDSTRIGAELKQGVLRVRLPRVQQAEPRRINVQVS